MHALSLAMRQVLTAPDAILDTEVPAGPMTPTALALLGLGGASLFCASIVLAAPTTDTDLALLPSRIAAFVLAGPLAGLLAYPPLFLFAMHRRAGVHPVRLAVLATSGLATIGLWLGAASPVVLLYALTGQVGFGFALLVLACVGAAGLAGARNVVRNGGRAPDASPGALVLLAHYAFTAWTALVLFGHLLP